MIKKITIKTTTTSGWCLKTEETRFIHVFYLSCYQIFSYDFCKDLVVYVYTRNKTMSKLKTNRKLSIAVTRPCEWAYDIWAYNIWSPIKYSAYIEAQSAAASFDCTSTNSHVFSHSSIHSTLTRRTWNRCAPDFKSQRRQPTKKCWQQATVSDKSSPVTSSCLS